MQPPALSLRIAFNTTTTRKTPASSPNKYQLSMYRTIPGGCPRRYNSRNSPAIRRTRLFIVGSIVCPAPSQTHTYGWIPGRILKCAPLLKLGCPPGRRSRLKADVAVAKVALIFAVVVVCQRDDKRVVRAIRGFEVLKRCSLLCNSKRKRKCRATLQALTRTTKTTMMESYQYHHNILRIENSAWS